MGRAALAVIVASCGLAGEASGQCTPSPTNFCVTVGAVYSINGVAQAPVTLVRGTTYTFQMVDVIFIHPFYMSTSASGGGLEMYTEGVSPTSVSGNEVMTFAVPPNAPSQLYYQCQAHTGMGGPINVVDPPSCYGNCDGSTATPVLNVADFTCFLQRYAAGESYANCDGSTAPPTLNVADFTCFLQRYAAGCP
jgi:hypothetical protein